MGLLWVKTLLWVAFSPLWVRGQDRKRGEIAPGRRYGYQYSRSGDEQGPKNRPVMAPVTGSGDGRLSRPVTGVMGLVQCERHKRRWMGGNRVSLGLMPMQSRSKASAQSAQFDSVAVMIFGWERT